MKTKCIERIEALQAVMKTQGWDAFLLPHNDVHLNEYLPDAEKWRDWLIGFSGSAGDALVLKDTVWLFADGRYYLQAEDEVPLSHVQVSKVGIEGHLSLRDTLKTLPPNSYIAYMPKTMSASQLTQLQTACESREFKWVEIPQFPTAPESHSGMRSTLRLVEASVHGKSTAQKIEKIRQDLASLGCDALVLSKLDDIAWLSNTRGSDIPYNPVFHAFVWIEQAQAILFANPDESPSSQEALNALKLNGFEILPYESVWERLLLLSQHKTVHWTPSAHSQAMATVLKSATLKQGINLVQHEKAVKTPEEIAGMKEANLRSSVAVVRTLAWLDAQADAGNSVSEQDLAQTIEGFYRAEGALDLSFNTIAGIGTNTAVIHYGTPSADVVAQTGDWILLDSGAQYPFGTTDITRTTTFGKNVPSLEHQKAYTHVLKAHIACASAIFPKGTSGAMLDGICRQPLWQAGYDYGHGTGHGVGCFLNVHEGPNGISKAYTEAMKAGSINSIEPGYYVPGWGGIRLENLALVVEASAHPIQAGTPQENWFQFELLNWIPFARHLIDKAYLNTPEKAWLQRYHQATLVRLTPRLQGKDESALAWLRLQCG